MHLSSISGPLVRPCRTPHCILLPDRNVLQLETDRLKSLEVTDDIPHKLSHSCNLGPLRTRCGRRPSFDSLAWLFRLRREVRRRDIKRFDVSLIQVRLLPEPLKLPITLQRTVRSLAS